VVAADVDDEGGRQTEHLGGGAVRFAHFDVSDSAMLGALIGDVAPTILVNNAGGGAQAPWRYPDATPEQWTLTLTVNLLAPMRATQAALPVMRAAGAGAVVNIASSAAWGPRAHGWPEYATAKAGLVRFTTSLRDFDAHVRINCLAPDWIATERLTSAELATDPPPIPLARVTEQVERLIIDDSLSGRVIVLDRARAPKLLD
jgi:NAD(P)-dependent dehydrogenase (short-subunit alcohol dehydrogenase family)